MSKLFVTTAISPMMINTELTMSIQEFKNTKVSMAGIDAAIESAGFEIVPAVGHEVTAKVLEPIVAWNFPSINGLKLFNRVNINMEEGDQVLAIIPSFRANEAREFTLEEVESAGFRIFMAKVAKRIPGPLEKAAGKWLGE